MGRVYFAFVLLYWAMLGCATPARAWEPAGIGRTMASTATVLAAYTAARHSTQGEYRETFVSTSDRGSFVSTALVTADAYRVDTQLDDRGYAMGRAQGTRWRETPQGVVRIIESDVQGDELDRWPLTVFGFATTDCHAGGETSSDWVLACKSPGGLPRWYYVNKSSGLVDREVSRDGTRVTIFDFSDYRESFGAMLPFHWQISGWGSSVDVRMTSRTPDQTAKSALAIPQSTTNIFALSGNVPVHIPVSINRYGAINLPVSVNGKQYRFVLDTGTTQILMDIGAATRAGLHVSMGHAVAPTMNAGGIRASNVALQAVDLFHDDFFDGILGNEFFIGHIVHVDYVSHGIDVLPRATFTPPPGSTEVPADCREGMPLVSVAIGGKDADRFAVDTGSWETVVSQSFLRASTVKWSYDDGDENFGFLEGALTVRPAIVDALHFNQFTFTQPRVAVTQENPNNLEFPLNGILASEMLEPFEWWYDYDGNRVWIRRDFAP